MKKWLQWVIYSVALVFSAALLVIGLLAGGIALLVQALIAFLTPVTGAAAAYAISGSVCLGSVFLVAVLTSLWLRRTRHAAAEGAKSAEHSLPDTYESVRIIVQEHPLESALVAFAVGLSASDADQLKKITSELIKEV